MYNLIANLPVAERKELYDQFIKGVAKIVNKNKPRLETFIFGVSPYLLSEFRKYVVSGYSTHIATKENSAGKYFSFSDISIQKVIHEWQLDVSIE